MLNTPLAQLGSLKVEASRYVCTVCTLRGKSQPQPSRLTFTLAQSASKMATNGQQLSKYVTLVSGDGFEFVVLREAACVSGAIKRMLDPKSMLSVQISACRLLYNMRGAEAG